MPSSTASSSPSPSLSSLTKGGDCRVSKLRQDWATYEDHALAERLQSQEIELHYEGNRKRNNQIREDFPRALEEQTAEATCAGEVRKEEERRNENIARRMAEELSSHDREQVKYEVTRDQIFARKIHALELRRHKQQEHKDLSKKVDINDWTSKQKASEVKAERDTSTTPPLPIMPNGDVPTAGDVIGACSGKESVKLKSTSALTSAAPTDVSFHDLKGGIRYNDHQYVVKTAVPATVVDNEPVYANNRPEHYAVSSPYPAAVIGVGEATNVSVSTSSELLNAAGLSQRDLALSKRAELQLEQERRDKELAERLQTQLQANEECSGQVVEAAEILKRKLEADDLQLAKALHAKEKAKLRRAKERSRMKKQYKREEEEEFVSVPLPDYLSNTHTHRQWQAPGEPQPDPLGTDRQSSRLGKENGAINKVKESLVSLPARRPYFNRGAIETAIGPSTVTMSSNNEIQTEPQYENLTSECHSAMAAATAPEQMPPVSRTGSRLDISTDIILDAARSHEDSNTPVPPYMPMQRSNKTSIMEKKIKRCKEKEGCHQQ